MTKTGMTPMKINAVTTPGSEIVLPAGMEFPPGFVPNNVFNITNSLQSESRGAISIDGEIGSWGVTAREIRQNLRELKGVTDIDVDLNTNGGEISEGIAIMEMFRASPVNINVRVQGYALSIGTVIAMGADSIEMTDTSLWMVHNSAGGIMGDANALRKEADVLDLHKEVVINAYLSRSAIQFTRDELWEMLDDETWYTAQMALDAGFIDRITAHPDEKHTNRLASLPRVAMAHAPQWAIKFRDAAEKRANRAKPKEDDEDDMKLNVAPTTTPAAAAPDVPAAPVVPTPRENAAATVTAEAASEAAVEARVAAARTAERVRAASIRNEFDSRLPGHTMGATISHHIDAETPMNVVTEIVNALVVAGTATPSAGVVNAGEDARDKRRTGMVAGLMARSGRGDRDNANEFQSMSLMEMVNDVLRANQINVSGDRKARVNAAFTHSTSDLPSVLYDVSHRAMILGYEEDIEMLTNHTRISSVGSMSDFRKQERYGRGAFENLVLKPEGGEYERDTLSFFKESNQLATYAKAFSHTREMIINDDMGAFVDIPAEFGRAARRTVAAKFWEVFVANPAMADGIDWIHASHDNLNAVSTPISTDSVDAHRTAMALTKGRNAGNPDVAPMGIRPNLLVCPAALEGRALLVRNNSLKVFDGATDMNRDYNVVQNVFDVVPNSHLDNTSPLDWYMIYGGMPPIEVSYLDGNQTPFMEQTRGWDVDGMEYHVRIDVGVSPTEFASIRKQVG